MSILIKEAGKVNLPFKVLIRSICCTQRLDTKEWRLRKGLPSNKLNSGPLTDKPDYTFLDGRPTPLLHKQKQRLLLQKQFAEQIVELNEHLDFAIQREKDATMAKEQTRQNIIENRLRPKGKDFFKKS